MRTRIVLASLVIALSLAGCAGTPQRGGAVSASDFAPYEILKCRGGDNALCVVVVQPRWCAPFNCAPTVDYPWVEVTGGANKIQWVLASRAKWRGAGIVFADPTMSCQPPTGSVVVCNNSGRVRDRPMKYTVQVQDMKDLDPWVVNN